MNEELVAPERTKSNIPAAFLTFLFARLHADAEPKAKKQEISVCKLFGLAPSRRGSVSFPVEVVSCLRGAPIASDQEFPDWVNFCTPAATSQ